MLIVPGLISDDALMLIHMDWCIVCPGRAPARGGLGSSRSKLTKADSQTNSVQPKVPELFCISLTLSTLTRRGQAQLSCFSAGPHAPTLG